MRLRPSVLLACALVVAAPFVAWARPAERVLPGQKVFGEIGSNDRATVLVDCVAGASLAVKCTAFRGTTPRLDLSLADPDGKPVELGTLKRTNAKGTLVSFRGVKVTTTGSYRVTVTTAVGNAGGFDLSISGHAPKSAHGTGTIDAADDVATLPFGAVPGDKVTCTVRAARRSKLKPLLLRFVDAGGASQTIDAARQPAPIVVATLGTSRFEVTGAGGSIGAFTWKLRFARARAPRTRRDAAELDAVGTITGTVVVDGQAPRPELKRLEKKAAWGAPDVRPGELIVSAPLARSHSEVEAAAEAAMPGTRCVVEASLSDEGPYLVRVEHLADWGAGARAKAATRALAKSASASSAVEWCEPNGIVQPCVEPTDPMYAQQYNLRQLKLPAAWNYTTGASGLVVAIIDTGSIPHPDLDAGYLPGYDFVADASNAMDGDGWDANPYDSALVRHGTHVAGLVAARTNNGVGIAGAAWNVKLLPVRALGLNGGSYFDVSAALRWAVGLPVSGAPTNPNPARVVNMSLGAQYDDPTQRATVAGVLSQTSAVIVAAAGNDSSSAPHYPSGYPGVISVYALDYNLKWTSYTNYGSSISVGAPGGDSSRGLPGILSTYASSTGQPSYAELEGTSMASPQVAGVVALILSIAPQLNAAQVKDLLQSTATDLGPPGFDNNYGWGVVNAEAAIASLGANQPPDALYVTPDALVFNASSSQAGLAVQSSTGSAVAITSIETTTDQLSGWLSTTANQMTTPASLSVTVAPTLAPGAYSGRIKITTAIGSAEVPVTVIRTPPPALTYATVSAVDEVGRVVARATATAATGWTYSLQQVPLGRYRITTFIDSNNDYQFDRVDEWDGIWPLRALPQLLPVTPESLDSDGVNLPIDRFDTLFDYSGVGSGLVTGALAVRVADARTGVPITGANVHFGGGAPVTVTDPRGRALVVGGINVAQVVTVTANGYAPMTRAGADAQYQGFALEPLTPAPTTTVTARVRGLLPGSRDVWLQIGDAKGHAVWNGSTDPVLTLTFTKTPDSTPISATVFDAAGALTCSALYGMTSPAGSFDVQVLPTPADDLHLRAVGANAPSSGFTVAGATLGATTRLRWNYAKWVAVGDSTLVFGQLGLCRWTASRVADPGLPTRFDVLATDATGRSTRRTFFGTTGDLEPAPASFTLDSPPTLTAPSNGAVGVSTSASATWSVVAGAQLHKVVIEEVGTSWRWTIWAPGTANQVQAPALSAGGLKPGTNYRWSVESFRFGATTFNAHAYLDEQLETEATSRVFSGWATFTTQ